MGEGLDVSIDAGRLLTRCRFPAPGAPVACALSGGADSSALVALAVMAGLDVTAWHVHHGIRPDADDDESVARVIADHFGVAFEVRRIVVEPGAGLEERAREARYRVLPPDVCTGHTADDRAETVLLNLGRGGGLAGVAAPYGRVRRPLLALRRFETRELCSQLGLVVADDPMNRELTYARVAIRTTVLPALADALGRDPVPLLNRHAELAADAVEVIRDLASGIDPTDAVALRDAPRAVASEAVRAWLMVETGTSSPPDAASVQRVLDVAAGRVVATEISGGHRVARTANRLRVEPSAGPAR